MTFVLNEVGPSSGLSSVIMNNGAVRLIDIVPRWRGVENVLDH